MIDDWFRTVELHITIDEFHRLPRVNGYKHEYFGGRAVLTPRPRNGYAVLDLARYRPLDSDNRRLEDVTIRPIEDADWETLGPLCGGCFHRVPPFSALSDDEQDAAGKDCMEVVRSGRDGPFVPAASMVAADEKDGRPRGALLVVLKPEGFAEDPWGWNRRKAVGPGPAAAAADTDDDDDDGVERKPRPVPRTQAHLDWVFVSPWLANRGVASAMLARTVEALRAAGHATLTSTFMVGNGESMAWHWRNGFELLQYPGSMRRFP